MRTSHLAAVAVSAIVGSKTAFSLGRLGDGKQSSSQESGSIAGKNLAAAPATKPPDGAKKSRQKLVRSNTESFVRRYVRVGSRLCENVDEPRLRRIVCSIAFYSKRSTVHLIFTSTKSRQNFYA
jgi:hypothetical protein